MNKYSVYVLYSVMIDSYYIGQSINVDIRLNEHLDHVMDLAHTKRATDWNVFHLIECENQHQAILIEQHLKRMKSRTYLENLKKYPEIGIRLLEKYQKLPD